MPFSDLIYRLRAIFRRSRMEADLDEEVRLHVEREAEAAIERGVPPDEAWRRARLALGGQEQVKEACRDARGVALLDAFVQDVRYAVRVLRKSAAYSVVSILTLALGIGVNSAIFSIVNGLLLRPLPVGEPGRLVTIDQTFRGRPNPYFSVSAFEQIRSRLSLFERSCVYEPRRLELSAGGEVDTVQALLASGAFFETLGVGAVLGRTFVDSDDRPGGGPGGPVAVISHAFWQARFGGAADAVGRSLTIDRVPYTVIGVTPREFFGPQVGLAFDVAIPVGTFASQDGRPDQVDRSLHLFFMARLRPDQTLASATAQLRAAQPAILGGSEQPELPVWTVVESATGGPSFLRNRFERPLAAMTILAGLVLLIVCASVANLSLARATVRQHEMCVRRALGASRLRLMRQVLVESMLLSGLGAGLGLLFADAFGPFLVRQTTTVAVPTFLDLSLDWRVLAFTAAVTAGVALLSGLVPAVRASRARPHDAVADGGRGQVGEGRMGLHHTLIVVQVSLSLALVVAAGLFVQTFRMLATMDLGFDPDRLLIVRVEGERSQVSPATRPALNERVRQAAASVPGVSDAVSLRSVPVSPDHWVATVEVPGQAPPPRGSRTAFLNSVGPGWFRMFGTRLLAGRGFAEEDQPGSELVAVVNEAFARRFGGGHSLVGERLRFGEDGEFGPLFRIVGLAKDSGAAIYFGLREKVPPTVYLHFDQRHPAIRGFTPLVSFRIGLDVAPGSGPALAPSVARAIRQVDPDLKTSFRTMSDYIDVTIMQERLAAILAGLFGSLAVLLAGVGLYGVTAYATSRRRPEIGLRIALGASPTAVVRTVLRRVVALTALGIAIGGAVSFWASRFLAAFLFGLQSRDPATFVTAAMLLASVALLAGWLPARRAARVDPAIVLRNE